MIGIGISSSVCRYIPAPSKKVNVGAPRDVPESGGVPLEKGRPIGSNPTAAPEDISLSSIVIGSGLLARFDDFSGHYTFLSNSVVDLIEPNILR